MLKLIVVSALLCTFARTINAQNNVTISKEFKLYKPFSTTIVDGLKLLTISANESHAIINSTEENSKPCVVNLDRMEHPIQKKVKAERFGDKIILWGVRSRSIINRIVRMDYTVIIINPKLCTYIPINTYEEVTMGFDVNTNLPEVVANDDSFDVYYSTMRTCTPCRYSEDGKRLDLKKEMEVEPLGTSTLTYVKPFNAPELNNGYFYAHSYTDGTSTVKLYDSNVNIVRQKKLKYRINAADVTSGDDSTITLCHLSSLKENPLHEEMVLCERLDANLNSVFATKLLLTPNHDPASVSLAINSAGDSYVSVIESNEDVDVFSLHKIKANGQVPISNIYKVGEMPRTRYYGGWQLRGFIFNDQYCFEVTKVWPIFAYPQNANENEAVKCVDI